MMDEEKFKKLYGKEPAFHELRQARAHYTQSFTLSKGDLKQLRQRLGPGRFNSRIVRKTPNEN